MSDGSGNTVVDWVGRLRAPAQSVDQRVKMPRWMAEFTRLGGELELCDAGIAELEAYARDSELVLVASGKGEIGRLFQRDASRSPFDKPMRALALTYVNNMPYEPGFSTVAFNLVPGVGEYFVFPALTTSGPCHIMVFEGVPGGEMDCWQGVDSPEQHLEISRRIVETFAPKQTHRCGDLELTDANGCLAGRFPPTIKHPVARLPSGAPIFGLADTVCLNDPITGQGSNNASKAAKVYLDAIVARGNGAFDEDWMGSTFERYWAVAGDVVNWTNALLLPPPPHVQQLLAFANTDQTTADRIANGFDNPSDFYPWFMEPEAAAAYMQQCSANCA